MSALVFGKPTKDKDDNDHWVTGLPSEHSYSRALWDSVHHRTPQVTIANVEAGVVAMDTTSANEGLIKLELTMPPSPTFSTCTPGEGGGSPTPSTPTGYYACRPSWFVHVGGFGIGCDDDVQWGGSKRAPIAVRFVSPTPFSMVHCDDTGYVGAEFWETSETLRNEGDRPSLDAIIAQAQAWLQGPSRPNAYGISTPQQRQEFEEALEYTVTKHNSINTFRKTLAPYAELLAESVTLWKSVGINTIDSSTARLSEVSKGVFCFPLFTPTFCAQLVAMIDAYEASSLPKRRPNTMNNFGMVINDIGLKPLMDDVLATIVAPLARRCFPQEVFAPTLDHHHSFVVVYQGAELGPKGDRGLDMHHDAAEITLNVCLGREGFTASGLRFCGNFGDSNHRQQQYTHEHTIGSAVMHLGRHRHGADSIASGERVNLIMWARSSAFRAAAAYQHIDPDGYPQKKETEAPHALCLSKANDRDYEMQVKALEVAVARE